MDPRELEGRVIEHGVQVETDSNGKQLVSCHSIYIITRLNRHKVKKSKKIVSSALLWR